jgi:N-acetylmuramic acid 6-phosphate etherase
LPTFGWPLERLVLLIAGGMQALFQGVEGAEDDARGAEDAVINQKLGSDDVLITLAASGRTPFSCAAQQEARSQGALTIGFANNPESPLLTTAHIPVLLHSGAEVIAGSTRLQAGTAQKIALNLFSCLLMIRLHRLYQGRMVCVVASNKKLQKRARHMLAELANIPLSTADELLQMTHGQIKPALLVARGVDLATAELLLKDYHGDLHQALAQISP